MLQFPAAPQLKQPHPGASILDDEQHLHPLSTIEQLGIHYPVAGLPKGSHPQHLGLVNLNILEVAVLATITIEAMGLTKSIYIEIIFIVDLATLGAAPIGLHSKIFLFSILIFNF